MNKAAPEKLLNELPAITATLNTAYVSRNNEALENAQGRFSQINYVALATGDKPLLQGIKDASRELAQSAAAGGYYAQEGAWKAINQIAFTLLHPPKATTKSSDDLRQELGSLKSSFTETYGSNGDDKSFMLKVLRGKFEPLAATILTGDDAALMKDVATTSRALGVAAQNSNHVFHMGGWDTLAQAAAVLSDKAAATPKAERATRPDTHFIRDAIQATFA